MWDQLVNAAKEYAGSQSGQGQSGGAGVWGFSQSGSADSNNRFGTTGLGLNIGGINTGTQGLDLTTIAIIGAVVIVALMAMKKR